MKEIEDFERTSDVSDHATKLEEISKEEAIKRVLRRTEKAPDGFDGLNCIDCGQPIPVNRLKTGAFRDIDCQAMHERAKKNHRSHYE